MLNALCCFSCFLQLSIKFICEAVNDRLLKYKTSNNSFTRISSVLFIAYILKAPEGSVPSWEGSDPRSGQVNQSSDSLVFHLLYLYINHHHGIIVLRYFFSASVRQCFAKLFPSSPSAPQLHASQSS